MNKMMTEARQKLGTCFREAGGAPEHFVPSICHVVRAMRAMRVLGAGLGFPAGISAPLRFPPPTSDSFGLTVVPFERSRNVSRPMFIWTYHSRVKKI